MAMRKPGAYAPLYANYADDERIMEVGEDAELMYVRMLAYAARTPRTEGWISDRVVLSRLGILPRAAGNGAGIEPGTDAGSRAGRLCDVGLIERSGEGFQITSWLKWNRSVEEMEREARRDSSRKRSATSANDGTDAGTDAGNGAGLPHAIPPAEAVQKTEQKQKKSKERETPLPASWAPTPEHFDRAQATGLRIDVEVIKFRTHCEEKGRTAVSWNAAFTRWLINAAEYAQRDGRTTPAAQPARRLQTVEELRRKREEGLA